MNGACKKCFITWGPGLSYFYFVTALSENPVFTEYHANRCLNVNICNKHDQFYVNEHGKSLIRADPGLLYFFILQLCLRSLYYHLYHH